MATTNATLSFLPWVRQGAASAVAAPDTLSAQGPGAADLAATLAVNDAPVPATTVRLRGPADVVGFDANQIVRTDPRPGSSDFESNCFASIEFDRADFPWLFTPASAGVNGRLRPWLCLVVVRKQQGVSLAAAADAPLAILQIASPAKPADELPDPTECWAWAHAQAAAADASGASVRNALSGPPELSLSRLVCPRLLAPDTDYIACVVPTFEIGRQTGLGLAVADAEVMAANALAPAWSIAPDPTADVQLPVYYHWEFRTGPGGDFAALAARLTAAAPAGLGSRSVDISSPGFKLPDGFPAETTVDVEGALQPLQATQGTGKPVLWSDAVAPQFEKALAEILNAPAQSQLIAADAEPLLAPPLYGRWHAARATATAGAAQWFDELNLDPRWRVAAALGTRVVQEHQEALMASAWEQAVELAQVNQRLRQLQVSLAVGESIHARHLSALTEEMMLRVASPVFSRIRVAAPDGSPRTLVATMMASALPVAATRPAMRRIGRQRGPLTRRVAAQGFARVPERTWVAALNFFDQMPAPPAPPATESARIGLLPPVSAVTAAVWHDGFRIVPEGQPMAPFPPRDLLPPAWDYPGFFRAAAAEHLARIRPAPTASLTTVLDPMGATLGLVRAQTRPRVTLPALARAIVATGDNALPAGAPGVTPVGLETVMAAPSFPQPMYEALRELSQELLLPGLQTVQPDTVLGLKTNRAFVDAYMVGLNVEMGRELLWRGFPTDQRGTCFRNFWDHQEGSAVTDIDDLLQWGDRALGAPGASTTTGSAEQFVMLLRSSLLRRYPNALVYLTPAVGGVPAGDSSADVLPIFSGAMDPDVSFFGFPVTPAIAVGDGGAPGYFVVIQEHPTEPRFGLNVGTLLGTATHLPIGSAPPPGIPLHGCTWGFNASHMAGITRRRPVRIAIHASQLVTLT